MKKETNNKTEIGNIIRLARGNRTYREYAKDADVNYSTINLIENGSYTPSIKMILKLTSQKAKPQNGISYEDAMDAAGYKIQDNIKERKSRFESLSIKIDKSTSIAAERQAKWLGKYVNVFERREAINGLAVGLIYYVIDKIGMSFTKVTTDDENENESGEKSVLLSIDKGRIQRWLFLFACNPEDVALELKVKDMLSKSLMQIDTIDMKISIVTNNPTEFARYEVLEHRSPFRGDLSILLVNIEENKIVKEVYLSNYYLDDRSSEFYLT